MAVAALVLGIIGIVFSWFPLLAVPLAIIGMILGIVARKNAVNTAQPTNMATAGLVVSVIGIAISILITVACISCVKQMDKRMQDPAFREQVRQRQEQFRQSQQQNDKEFNEAFKNAVDHTQKPGPGATTVPAPAPAGSMPAPLGDAPAAKPAPALPPSQPQK